MLKNLIIRTNYMLDNNENAKFVIVLLIVLACILCINLGNLIIMSLGISLIVLLSIFTLLRMRVLDGKLKYDTTKLPEEGEIIVIKKKFFVLNGEIFKAPLAKEEYCEMDYMSEWIIKYITPYNGSYEITLENKITNECINLEYFESRKYWETKSEMRNRKLNKLLR